MVTHWTLVTVGAAVWEMMELLLPRLAWRCSTRYNRENINNRV